LEIGILIPADDSVRLLNAVMERMDYRKLYDAYSPYGRDGTSPKALFKVLVYGYMNGFYSSRKIERACLRDINFMYLLGGAKAPDHNTIARFRTMRLNADVMDDLFGQFTMLLAGIGELSCENIFIDGTKLEAFPNRYKFVWKKSVEKQSAKMQEKMKKELPASASDAGFAFEPAGEAIQKEELSELIEKLRLEKKRRGAAFVSGTGKRKTALQKLTEAAEGYLARMKRYENDLEIMGDRNSYAKTDHDATFMRMKEDHMGNGQLKPAYNVAMGADAEYIASVAVFQDRSDSGTLIPFMKRLEKSIRYKNVVTDAGYESEENYSFLEAAGYSAFIKPSNYETSKTKKYRTDIGLRENMPYDEDADNYICHMGYPLENVGIKRGKSKSGYPIETTVYECKNCMGCPCKERCIKPGGKLSIAERSKRLHVSKTFLEQRRRALQRITSEQGVLLCVNRSIQAEGAFGVLKQDMGFRRFLLRSKVKVRIEISLLCFAYNVKKLHNKIQSGRLGMYLHPVKAA
jgi:transposase